MLPPTTRDRYTAFPSRVGRRARSQDARSSEWSTGGSNCASRHDLLGQLVASVAGEGRAIQSLLINFGLDEEQDFETMPSPESQDVRVKSRPTTNAAVDKCWEDSLEVLDKNQYLLTPIRTRLFPKASPGVLRSLLRTPSLRAFTPDQSILPEDSSLLGPPLQKIMKSGTAADIEHGLCTKETFDGVPVRDHHVASLHHGSRFLLPSPPPSTELPSVESFCPPGAAAAESSPAGLHHAAKRREPSWDTRRSSQGRRSPVPELILSGLRAAPCSPLLTTRSVVHDRSPPLSSVPTARATRAFTDRRVHAHRDLAFGVVRDFQRVLDELQGLGDSSLAGVDDHSDPEPLAAAQAPSPSMNARTGSVDLRCGASARRPVDTASCIQHTPLTDRKNAPRKQQPAPDSFPSGGATLLGHMGDRSLADGRASTSSAPSTPCNGLEDEFVRLLVSQAEEEDAQAELLRTIADRLGNFADRKKHLANAMLKRNL